jgi:hypothetical protein
MVQSEFWRGGIREFASPVKLGEFGDLTLFLDRDLRIRTFTPAMTDLINVRTAEIHHWHFPREFVPIGNCGSPIELDEGWLLFIRGPVRGYSTGAPLSTRSTPPKCLLAARRPSALNFAVPYCAQRLTAHMHDWSSSCLSDSCPQNAVAHKTQTYRGLRYPQLAATVPSAGTLNTPN